MDQEMIKKKRNALIFFFTQNLTQQIRDAFQKPVPDQRREILCKMKYFCIFFFLPSHIYHL